MLILWMALGLLAGVGVNYLADVLPTQRRLAKPSWWPLNADTLKHFAKPRSWLVLVAMAGAAVLIGLFPPVDLHPLVYFVVLAYFLLVTVIDFEHRLVLHVVSLAGVLLMGAVGISRHGLSGTLLGGVAGFGGMLALQFLGNAFARILGRLRGQAWDDDALGFGDVNLMGVIGLLMGWPGVIAAALLGMLLAGLAGGIYMLFMRMRRKYTAFTTIAYAPYLCAGAAILLSMAVY